LSGICGFIGNGDKTLLKKMLKSIMHRGGNEEIFIFKDCGFGVTKSLICDIDSLGCNNDESIYVIYDGELYNREDLIKNLDESIDPDNISQSKIICLLYEKYGKDFINKIIGPFALVLWDSTKRILILGRDKLGEKPICYYKDDNIFLFSSEIKSFLNYDNFIVQVDSNSLSSYMRYLFVPTPNSIFKGVYKIPPGNYLEIDSNRNLMIREYSDLTLTPILSLNENQILKKMDEYFTESIRSRIDKKDKLGVLLSAGTDSNIVASKMSLLSKDPINSFTLGFDNEAYNELESARYAAESYKTIHYDFQIGSELFNYLPEAIWHMDEPHGDSGLLSLFYVNKMAYDKKIFNMLTGDGGDELFWGYPWNLEKDGVDIFFKFPSFARKISYFFCDTLSHLNFIEFANKTENLKKYELVDYPKLSPREKFFTRTSAFLPNELLEIYSSDYKKRQDINETHDIFYSYYNKYKNIGELYLRGYVTLKTVFVDNGLFKGDRMSGIYSIDTVHPLLNYSFVDFSLRIPAHLKIKNGIQKYIWKQYANKYNLIPKKLLKLKKTGFGIPIEYWFKKELKGYLEQEILEKKFMRKFFDKNYIKKLMEKSHQYENAHRLFSLLSFSVWYEKFINN
jgi:asparagine synthase (glutamine-hydrolysing)